MKVLSIIKYTFSMVGVALPSGAVTSYRNINNFLKEAVPDGYRCDGGCTLITSLPRAGRL
ncbi:MULTISPECIES: hypothetical protein [Pseudomonas]|jgi:hypothetical protein|uniref:hypothetical protein n=1 Tax=Pseudomonas TaxID=286 RepID=UPI00062B19C6|nr:MULTISPECIES: hypothetical protein [Pseudomonas]KKX62464.1 hypothetical protein PU99_12030 [Pseudomonas putida]